jgi:hypothetical protein
MAQNNNAKEDNRIISVRIKKSKPEPSAALYSDKEHQITKKVRFERVQKEICSPEFQELLDRVFAAGKISGIRYYALKMKNYRWFYFLRRIYRYIN